MLPQRIIWLSLKEEGPEERPDDTSKPPVSTDRQFSNSGSSPTEVVTEFVMTTTEEQMSDGADEKPPEEPSDGDKKQVAVEDLFPPSVIEPFKSNMPVGLVMRPLQVGDFHKGYVELLAQLTSVGEISAERFEKRFRELQTAKPFAYYTIVIEDEGISSVNKIAASATLVIEWKFIHECGARGRIEDVIVNESHRGMSLGRHLSECLVKLGAHLGVYKMSLECKTSLIDFYGKFGFHVDDGNHFLVQRFDK